MIFKSIGYVNAWHHQPLQQKTDLCSIEQHSVETPSMADPQWNKLYWWCIFHTVCWDSVGCEWGAAIVHFGITYVCFTPKKLPAFAVGLKYQHWFFHLCK